MNSQQNKIIQTACYVFAPILFVGGIANDSFVTAVLIPVGLIFLSIYLKKATPISIVQSEYTTDAYVELIKDDFIKTISKSWAHELKEVIPDEHEVENFIFKNLNFSEVKPKFVGIMNLLFTQREIAKLAEFNLSPEGRKFLSKQHELNLMFKDALNPEIERLSELLIEAHAPD